MSASAVTIRPGFLAIWSDVTPEAETDYLHWMTREHAVERLGIPGFLSMRMFRGQDVPQRRYFILYELESAAVVGSAAYLARLNQPSAWTTRVMAHVSNFIRGGGSVDAVAGTGQGGFIAALPLEQGALTDVATLAAAARSDRIAAARVLVTDHGRTGIQTQEKGLRAGDRSFPALLLIEGLVAAAVQAAAASVSRPKTTVYETIFALKRS